IGASASAPARQGLRPLCGSHAHVAAGHRMMGPIIVYVTAGSPKEADRIAQALIEEKLAACVSIVPQIVSRYRWKGHIENQEELLLIIKSFDARFARLEKRVRELHSYEIPEIVAVPAARTGKSYMAWMNESMK